MNQTSYPLPLSAKDPNAFAYPSMKDRVPVILSKIVDHLNRNRDKITADHGGEAGREQLKTLIGAVSQLRYEVMTNKAAAALRDSRSDTSEWNAELERQIEIHGEEMKWFDSAWLWMECYLYRRVQESSELCTLLRGFDVFADQKQDAFSNSYKPISTLTMHLLEVNHKLAETVSESEILEHFSEFLQVCLWGNKCDLSISGGSENNQIQCPLEQLKKLKPFILVDDTNNVFQTLSKVKEANGGRGGRVDFVLDNAGFELVTDLCLAEFLMTSGLASQIHFHAKAMPWFVSDVTVEDFNWTLQQMGKMNHIGISKLCQKWKKNLQEEKWTLEVNDFWTMPYDHSQMKEKCPGLYSQLSQSDFIVFKGDLNYRKLVGDLQWDTTTDFTSSLRGFQPAPLCVLRTLKSDVVVSLKPGQAKETAIKDDNWMTNGEWAVISASTGSRNDS